MWEDLREVFELGEMTGLPSGEDLRVPQEFIWDVFGVGERNMGEEVEVQVQAREVRPEERGRVSTADRAANMRSIDRAIELLRRRSEEAQREQEMLHVTPPPAAFNRWWMPDELEAQPALSFSYLGSTLAQRSTTNEG